MRLELSGRLVIILTGWLIAAAPLAAQGTTARPARPSTALRSLETKAQEAQSAYLTQLGDLAKGYEDAGNVEQAQETLRQILKVNPQDAEVQTKLKELQEKVFNDNQKEIEVDASKGWTGTGLRVVKGQVIRIEAQGSYKFIVNTDIGPDGFPTKDVANDMGDGVATGALMGTIFKEAAQRGRPPQALAPFQIGSGGEIRPEDDGILFLRLNVPAGSKCIGKVKVMVTGNIAPTQPGR